MSETQPNAFRVEAQEKRTLSVQLANEADALDAQADALEGKSSQSEEDTTEAPQLPPGGATYDPEEESKAEEKPSKIPFKK